MTKRVVNTIGIESLWSHHWKKILYIAVFLVWSLATTARLLQHGIVYGLNFELFQPDGINYLRLTQDISNLKMDESTVYSWTRPLYPVLSVVFFLLLGKSGMLVVPILSFLITGILLQLLGETRNQRIFFLGCFLLLTCSSTFLRWNIADLTDSLHLSLFVLCCVGIRRNWNFANLLTVVLLGSLTRPMGPIWAALFVAFYLSTKEKRNKRYMGLAIISFLFFGINTLVMALLGGFAPQSLTLLEQISQFPLNLVKVTVVEFGQLAVMDRFTFFWICAATILCLFNQGVIWCKVHIFVLISSLLLSGWLGVLGVNFRYQLPSMITAFLGVFSILLLWAREGNVRIRCGC